MRTHDRSRFLAWLLLVAMVLTMLPTAAFAADAATYAKVDLTAAEDITAGQYLIYGTSIQATDSGATAAFMSTAGSTSSRLMSSDLTIVDGKASTSDANCVWNLIAADGGFYVQNAGNGKYLYYGSKTGNNIYQTENLEEAGIWTVMSHDGVWTLQETASQRQLSCNRFGNPGSYYLGFASYVPPTPRRGAWSSSGSRGWTPPTPWIPPIPQSRRSRC